MQCMRKRKKLRLVVCKPWCLLWQDSRAAFEFLRLNEHTNLFAVLRLDRHRRQANVFELGHKSGPNSSIFNQNRAGWCARAGRWWTRARRAGLRCATGKARPGSSARVSGSCRCCCAGGSSAGIGINRLRGNSLLQLPTPLRRGRADRCDLLSASSCFFGPSLLTRSSPTFNRLRRQSYSISVRDAQSWAISSWMTLLFSGPSRNPSPRATTLGRTIAMVT